METSSQYYDRYPGTRPFADNEVEQKLFFGRDREIHELLHQILSTNLLVLYGKSGLGKTSLLQAGIYPRLREDNFLPLKIRLNDQKQKPLDLFFQSIDEQCQNDDIDYTSGERTSLWEFFKTVLFLRGESLQLPVLVIDQFEELFTLQDDSRRAVIAQELADLTSTRLPEKIRAKRRAGEQLAYSDRPPEVKIILVLREDYYGILQELIGPIPTILEQRYWLTAFNERQARTAMQEPALVPDEHLFTTKIFRYESNTINKMIKFLKGRSGIIEPFQLQILCQYVEQQVRQRQANNQSQVIVDESYLGDGNSIQIIMKNFYKDSVQKIPTKRQQERTYQLCEEGLLNHQGQRLSLEEGELKKDYRISSETLNTLVDTRLLRKEARLESFYYEISHDSIAQSIAKNRPFRMPKYVWYGGTALMALIVFLFLFFAEQLQRQFLSEQLAKSFWSKALEEKHEKNSPLKAAHYFMRAAKHTVDSRFVNNAQLAGKILVQNSSLSTILTFKGTIRDANFHSDGGDILTESIDGKVYRWDPNTPLRLPKSVKKKNDVSETSSTILSPDRKRVFTWHADGTAELRDRDSDIIVANFFHEKDKAIWGAVFHPNGDQILTWGADGTARLCDPMTTTPLILRHTALVRGAMYSPDKRRVLTWSDDKTARVWDRKSGDPLTEPLLHEGRVWGADFSTNGKQILTWSEDGTARIWNISTEKSLLLTHNASVRGAKFGPSGQSVLTWSEDQTARVWDQKTGNPLTPPLYHPGVMGAALDPEERRILTWSPDGTVRLWVYIPDSDLSRPLGQPHRVRGVAFSPDGDYILTLDRKGNIQLWDSMTLNPLPPLPDSQLKFRGAIFRPNSKQILAWEEDGTIRLWRVQHNRINLLLADKASKTWGATFSPDRKIWGAIFSPDGEQILTWGATGAGTASLWSHPQHNAPPITKQGQVRDAVFSPDGQQLLTWSLDGTARSWDSKTGKEIAPPLTHQSPVRGAIFSPDGHDILIWTADGSLQRWDRHKRLLLPSKLTGTDEIQGIAFSSDGFRFLTWNRNENLRLLDSASSDAFAVVVPQQESVSHAAFSPDGLRIVILDKAGNVWVRSLLVSELYSRKQLDLDLEVRTGTRLNDKEELEALSPEEWKKAQK